MAPEQFAAEWGEDEMAAFPLQLINQFPLRFTDKQFLLEAGLPNDAAPFLSFGAQYATSRLFSEVIGDCFQIGSNGSGDPVILTPDGQIRYLNHDAGFASHYINCDLPTLAEALLGYRHLIKETVTVAGPDAFLDGLVPQHLRENWIMFLRSADPAAIDPGSFWADEVATWTPI
jgi:hypothetical protein